MKMRIERLAIFYGDDKLKYPQPLGLKTGITRSILSLSVYCVSIYVLLVRPTVINLDDYHVMTNKTGLVYVYIVTSFSLVLMSLSL